MCVKSIGCPRGPYHSSTRLQTVVSCCNIRFSEFHSFLFYAIYSSLMNRSTIETQILLQEISLVLIYSNTIIKLTLNRWYFIVLRFLILILYNAKCIWNTCLIEFGRSYRELSNFVKSSYEIVILWYLAILY